MFFFLNLQAINAFKWFNIRNITNKLTFERLYNYNQDHENEEWNNHEYSKLNRKNKIKLVFDIEKKGNFIVNLRHDDCSEIFETTQIFVFLNEKF